MLKSRDCGIQIWFWPRDSLDAPPEITLGGAWSGEPLIANPLDTWGPPDASFPVDPNYCDYNKFFDAHQIVFDLTFCVSEFFIHLLSFPGMTEVLSSQGDWAGNAWPQSGCGIDTCENCKHLLAFTRGLRNSSSHRRSDVDNNPTAFREAYWEINGLRVYTPDLPYPS
jgi:hypothetical protein